MAISTRNSSTRDHHLLGGGIAGFQHGPDQRANQKVSTLGDRLSGDRIRDGCRKQEVPRVDNSVRYQVERRGSVRVLVRVQETVIDSTSGPRTVPTAGNGQRGFHVGLSACRLRAPHCTNSVTARRLKGRKDDVGRTVSFLDGDVCHRRHSLKPWLRLKGG